MRRKLALATDRLPGARAGGLTPLFVTIIFAANFLAKQGDPHAEKVLIVFSDGLDTASRSSLSNAINASLRGEVQMDCIDLNKPADNFQGTSVSQNYGQCDWRTLLAIKDGAEHALNVILEGFRASYAVTYRLLSRSTDSMRSGSCQPTISTSSSAVEADITTQTKFSN